MGKQVEQEVEQEKAKRYESVTFELPTGNITFFNAQLVTRKTLGIMLTALEEGGFEPEGSGVYSVVFRNDGLPINENGELNNWVYYSDPMSAVCNLEHCMDMAIRDGQSGEYKHAEKLSFRHSVWQLLLGGFFHELHHGHSYLTDGEKVFEDEELLKEEEELANEFSRQMLFTLAKLTNIEPDFSDEIEKMIDSRWEEELKLIAENWDSATETETAWFRCQKVMKDNPTTCWFDQGDGEEREYSMLSYKEFLHWCSGEDDNDPDWNTDTTAINIVAQEEPEPEEELPFEPDTTTGFQGVQQHDPVNGFQGVNVVQPHQPENPVVENQPVYENPTLDINSFQNVIKGLYLKLFQNIFQGCGFNPTGRPPFVDGTKICQPLGLTRQESMIVKEMMCYNQNGQRGTMAVENFVLGVFMNKDKTLPGYDLTLTDINGNQVKRKFIPQNPNKVRNDGQLSSTAAASREGHQIMWIINPDGQDKQFALRVWNGVLQSNNSGQWTNI